MHLDWPAEAQKKKKTKGQQIPQKLQDRSEAAFWYENKAYIKSRGSVEQWVPEIQLLNVHVVRV